MRSLTTILTPALLLLSAHTLVAQEDWTQQQVTIRVEGQKRSQPLRVERAGEGYRVGLPLGADHTLYVTLSPDGRGGYAGRTRSGMTGVLQGEAEVWKVTVRAPHLARRGRSVAAGVMLRGTQRSVGFDEAERRRFTLRFRARPQGSPPASVENALPKGLSLVPGLGAPEDELRRALKTQRGDELTLIYWNIGKGEHKAGLPVAVGEAEVDPLNANIRALAGLKPDFLVLAETPASGLLDAGTRTVLAGLLPGRLRLPSIKGYERANGNAIFSRYALTRSGTPSDETAVVSSAWLDWTPPGASASEVAAFRARWTRNSDWHTRAHTRIDLTLRGEPVSLFPVHFAMPWLELDPTTIRDGFRVDGLQDHQLHRRGPLYYQIERARAEYAKVAHGRVAIFGDCNVSEFPRAAFPPLKVDPSATGDGAPDRERSLAFELLAKGYHNAFAGDRAVFSWPNPSTTDRRALLLPRQLIDNCLVGGGLEVRYRAIAFPRGSDHGALVVKLRLHAAGTPYRRPRAPRREPRPDADRDPPEIQITRPRRGELVSGDRVEVRGKVVDRSEVVRLTVAGTEVPLATDGSFRHTLFLRSGLNFIELRAVDRWGNQADAWRSVASGKTLSPTRPVEDALSVRISSRGVALATVAANRRLAKTDLQALLLAKNPLLDDTYGGGRTSVDLKLEASRLKTGAPSLTLTPTDRGLRVEARVPDVRVQLKVSGTPHLWSWSTSGPIVLHPTLTTREATVEGLAHVSVKPNGAIQTSLTHTQVALKGFKIDVMRLLPDFAERIVTRAIRDYLQDMFRGLVAAQVPPAVDGLVATYTRTMTKRVLGRTVAIRPIVRQVQFRKAGVYLRLAGEVSVAGRAGDAPPPLNGHRGSLGTPGAAPHPNGAGPDVVVSLNDDTLNRLAYAAWRTGALAMHIDAASSKELKLPAWTRRVDVGWVRGFFPEVAGLQDLPAATPIRIDVTPLAPPMFAPRGGGKLEVALGDLQVTISAVPANGGEVRILRASAQARVHWKVTTDGRSIQVALADTPEVHTDVYECPLGSVTREGVEGLLDYVLPTALEKLTYSWSNFPTPVGTALRHAKVGVGADGPGGDFTSLSGGLPF